MDDHRSNCEQTVKRPNFAAIWSLVRSVDIFDLLIFTLPFVVFLGFVHYKGSSGAFLYLDELPEWVEFGYVSSRWLGMLAAVAFCREVLVHKTTPNPLTIFFNPTVGRLLGYEILVILALGIISFAALKAWDIYTNIWLFYLILLAIGMPFGAWILCRAFKFPVPKHWFWGSYSLAIPFIIYGLIFAVCYGVSMEVLELILEEGFFFFYLETLLTIWFFGVCVGAVQLNFIQYFCYRSSEEKLKPSENDSTDQLKRGWEEN